jgi:hypothetical protein
MADSSASATDGFILGLPGKTAAQQKAGWKRVPKLHR